VQQAAQARPVRVARALGRSKVSQKTGMEMGIGVGWWMRRGDGGRKWRQMGRRKGGKVRRRWRFLDCGCGAVLTQTSSGFEFSL
jgi:hypothetical protein